MLALVAVLVAVYLGRSGSSPAAAKLAPLPAFQGGGPVRADVNAVDAGALTLTTRSGQQRATVAATTRVEALLPIDPADVAVGDYLSVGGVPNLVNAFAIKLVVDIPAGVAASPSSGPPRTRAGFTGWEAYADANQSPEVYGRVESIESEGVHLAGPLGPITVTLAPGSPLRRVTPGGAELIHGGDHVALMGTSPSAPASVLVLPGQ